MRVTDSDDVVCALLHNLCQFGIAEEGIKCDIELVRDDSQYCVVDGEEGDYGIVNYFIKSTIGEGLNKNPFSDGYELVCQYINHGGDVEEWVFTQLGIDVFGPIVLKIITDSISAKLKLEVNEIVKPSGD